MSASLSYHPPLASPPPPPHPPSVPFLSCTRQAPLGVTHCVCRNKDDNVPYKPSENLVNICQEKGAESKPFTISLLWLCARYVKLISCWRKKKSAGAKILKLSILYIVESLTYMHNSCITQNIFPSNCKNSKVVPIPKSRDASQVNNFPQYH